jgi:hypothetical protein
MSNKNNNNNNANTYSDKYYYYTFNYIYNDYNTNHNNIIFLKREIDKWNDFSYILRNKIEDYSKKCYNRHTNIQMQ